MASTEVLPKAFQKLMVVKKSLNFREAVSITTESMPSLKPHEFLVQNKYLGINASDIIRSAGKYFHNENVPFDVGYEGIGKIVVIGDDVTKYKKDQYVVYLKTGAYSEYIVLSESKQLVPLPDPFVIEEPKPEYLAIAGLSGLTAKLALEKCGELKCGETVLVTAAAGGTGQLAVLFAKQKNCHVIGTCSTKEKASFLKSAGCDRVVVTTEENLKDVLDKEYPKGIDVVFESVGGEMFGAALSSLAIGGRLLIIGYISGYKSGTVPETDIQKFANEFIKDLIKEHKNDGTKIRMDDGQKLNKVFSGIEGIIDAVEYLHSGKNCGKVYATL